MDAHLSRFAQPRVAPTTTWVSSLEQPRPIASLLLVSVGVGVGRAALELTFAGLPRNHSVLSTLTSVAFYVEAWMLFATVLRVAARVNWQAALSVASAGLVLGLLPPIVDMAVGGPGAGSYSYYFRSLEDWPVMLFDRRVATFGEPVALWCSLGLASGYVLLKTRNLVRAALALALGYSAIVLLAVLPEAVWAAVAEPLRALWSNVRDAREFSALAVQLGVALLVYTLNRRGAFTRIASRSLHVLPFLCLIVLGAATRHGDDELGRLLVNPAAVILAIVLMTTVTLSAIVSNDALDADLGRPASRLRSQDAALFGGSAALFSAAGFLFSPRVGLPLLCALLLSRAYHDRHRCGKARFPINGLIEGAWAWCCFAVGYYCHPRFNSHMSATALSLSLGVFLAWLMFSVFKDCKDVRFDWKLRTQTIYTIAVRRGWPLRTLHLSLVAVFAIVSSGALALVGRYWGVGPGLGVAAVAACAMCIALTSSASKRTVQYFLAGASLCVLGVAWQIISRTAGA